MVTKWGLSQKLGPLTYSEEEGEVFLGHSVAQHKSVSDETAHAIDKEIRAIVDRNYERSQKILTENTEKLHKMAEALIKYETIDKDQINDIMAGKEPRPPRDWGHYEGEGPRPGGKVDTDERKKPDSKIGDPASQH